MRGVLRLEYLFTNLYRADFIYLTFDSVGMPYDLVTVKSTTNLSPYLDASGIGKYSGIVSVKKSLLSASQQSAIINYQLQVSLK